MTATTDARAGDNPFRTSRLEALAMRLPGGISWDAAIARLADLGWRAALVGPHGSGKTTLLEQLVPRLPVRARHLTLTLADPRPTRAQLDASLADLAPDELVLYDGACHLPLRLQAHLRRRTRAAAGLVVTRHRTHPFALPTWLRTTTSPALLRELAAELDPARQIDAEALHARHRGDLRAALLSLYDRAAGRI